MLHLPVSCDMAYLVPKDFKLSELCTKWINEGMSQLSTTSECVCTQQFPAPICVYALFGHSRDHAEAAAA